MMRRVLMISALLSLATLGGCAWVSGFFGGTDNTEPPAPLVKFKPTLHVKTLWTAQVGSGAGKLWFKLTPLVRGGKVYAAAHSGVVRAFNAATGDTLWRTDTHAPISTGIGGGEGVLLMGTSDGHVLALNAADGKPMWRVPVSSVVLAAPQVAQGVVVVHTVDDNVFGLEAKTGKRLWVYGHSAPSLTLRGSSSPALVNGMVLCGFGNGKLAALSLTEGKLIWEATIAVPRGRSELQRMVDIDAAPKVAGNNVYVVTYHGRVAELTLNAGQILWSRDMSSYEGLSVDGDRVFVTDADSQVWALDRRTGASLWKQDKLRARSVTRPVPDGRYIVVGDYAGYVHWLSQDDGHFAARVRVDSSSIIAPPVVSGDTVYVYSRGGVLAALRAGKITKTEHSSFF